MDYYRGRREDRQIVFRFEAIMSPLRHAVLSIPPLLAALSHVLDLVSLTGLRLSSGNLSVVLLINRAPDVIFAIFDLQRKSLICSLLRDGTRSPGWL